MTEKKAGGCPSNVRKIPPEVIAMFRQDAPAAMARLKKLMSDKDKRISLDATKFFLDKCFGRNFRAMIDNEDDETATNMLLNILDAVKNREVYEDAYEQEHEDETEE
ncbi:MAG: hypothetical protein RR490_09420 [Niameybacter sp.]